MSENKPIIKEGRVTGYEKRIGLGFLSPTRDFAQAIGGDYEQYIFGKATQVPAGFNIDSLKVGDTVWFQHDKSRVTTLCLAPTK